MRIEKNDLTRSALLITIGLILPAVFHTFNLGGQVFLPMHIPVFVGGFILSPLYAAAVGLVTPLLSSIFTGMPQMPFSFSMMFELCTYGGVVSLLYHKYFKNIYAVMVLSMIAGRIAGCIGNYIILTFASGKAFSLTVYLKTVVLIAAPGIMIQLILIPVLVKLLIKYESEHFKRKDDKIVFNENERTKYE